MSFTSLGFGTLEHDSIMDCNEEIHRVGRDVVSADGSAELNAMGE